MKEQQQILNNSLSLIFSIISLILSCVWYYSAPFIFISLMLGIIGVRKSSIGKGMAISGIIISCIALFAVIYIYYFFDELSKF